MQDRSRQFDEIFLQRTAGPYIWVKADFPGTRAFGGGRPMRGHTASDALAIVAAVIHDLLPPGFRFAEVDACGDGNIGRTMTILFAVYRWPYSVKT
jgi:hypothetical protein